MAGAPAGQGADPFAPDLGSGSIPGMITQTSYDAAGRTLSVTYANGMSTNNVYSETRGWLLETTTSKDGNTFLRMVYTRDAAGCITAVASLDWGSAAARSRRAARRRSRSGSPASSRPADARMVQAWASAARPQPIRHPSGRFRSAGPSGYAAAGWSGSTWHFQVRLQHPSGSIAIPATQPQTQPLSDGLSGWPRTSYVIG